MKKVITKKLLASGFDVLFGVIFRYGTVFLCALISYFTSAGNSAREK